MPAISKSQIAALGDAEALSAFKPAVALFSEPGCPITPIPEPFIQPSEVQAAYDGLKSVVNTAHPNDSKQTLALRGEKRKSFNDAIGRLVDLVQLGSQKQPDLLARFSLDDVTMTHEVRRSETRHFRLTTGDVRPPFATRA